ncbi:MAG: HAMP domain-containing histidine kinase [Xanthomonadaceae bacterium]|nr:HAMP domain-containing histidine kinase [Xanthomonadaceae bacterium]
MPSPAESRRMRYRRRLRSRLIVSFALLGFALTATFALATLYLRDRTEEQVIGNALVENINDYARQFYVDPAGAGGVPLENIQGRVFSRAKFGNVPPEWAALPNGVHQLSGTDERGRSVPYKLAVRKDADFWFFVRYENPRDVATQQRLTWALFGAVIVFSLGSLVLGLWSSRRVMRPVTDLARRIGELRVGGEPKKLADRFADDEVGQLAAAFDDYAERLNASIRRDREFNADVSHELRTPLAVIGGAAERLLAKPDLDDKTRARLKRIERAAQQCTDLTVALLMLSRNERGRGHADVRRIAGQLAEANRQQLVGKSVVVVVEGRDDVHVDAPEAVLAVALGNLIGNACKYTQQGEVRIVVGADRVEVFDTGPGLSDEDAARLFERGYRGSSAGGTSGGGIGLSIVSRLCALYAWKVSVRPRPEGGAVATLELGPAAG